MKTKLPPRAGKQAKEAEPRSLLDEPVSKSKAEITHTVQEDDVRAAVWLGHKWTKRLLVGGGGGVLGLLITLAGLWGNAVLNSFEGIRTDVQAYMSKMDARMERADEERRDLALSNAATKETLRAYDARLQGVEAKCDMVLMERYNQAWSEYEKRRESKPETPGGS